MAEVVGSSSKAEEEDQVGNVDEEIGFEHLEEVADVEDWQDGEEREDGDTDPEAIPSEEAVSGETTMVIVEAEAVDSGGASTSDSQEVECTVCKQILGSKNALGAHMRKAHQQGDPSRRNHICSFCNKAFTTSSNLQQHKRLHFNERPFQCNRCNKGFATSTNLKQHYRTHTGDRPFPCNYCPKRFATNSNLRQHIRTHTGERPHVCRTCGKGFIDAAKLSNHERVHTKDKPFMCSICEKVFATSNNLKAHSKTHSVGWGDSAARRKKATDLSQSGCGVSSQPVKSGVVLVKLRSLGHGEQQADIIADSTIQASVKSNSDGSETWEVEGGNVNLSLIPPICLQQYICNDCNKVYSNSSNLAQHRRTIHPKDFVRRYLCEYCEKTFSLVTNLRRHQKKTCPNAQRKDSGSESARQTWPCDDCGKICSTKGNLKSHKFTHLGIKMYECFICEKKFTTNSNLKQHLIVHDGKYNGLQPKRKKITLQIRDDKHNDSSVEPDPNETSQAVRTLQVVSEGSTPLKEEYIAVTEAPAMPKGRTQRPLIVKVDVDRDVKPKRSSIPTKPILLPPPPLRLS